MSVLGDKVCEDLSENKAFKFSVVVAVYNVEDVLDETIESITNQDIGFLDNVQIILVNDGSVDRSGEICKKYHDQYPDNIVFIDKLNEGAARARNSGIQYAEGKYLNFLDSDDKLSAETLSNVYDFFEEHYDETDVVAIPMTLFDEETGPHWQNWKFERGSRVINLLEEYTVTCMSCASSFYKASRKNEIHFDSRLANCEDLKVNLCMLNPLMTLGVVREAEYLYRRRIGSNSLSQSMTFKKSWYLNFYEHLILWAYELYNNEIGFFPGFVQYVLLCDFQWRVRIKYDPSDVLDEYEVKQYKEYLRLSVKLFDEKYIWEQKKIFREHKVYLLKLKYGLEPHLTKYSKGYALYIANKFLGYMDRDALIVEFIQLKNNHLVIEGYSNVIGSRLDEIIEIYISVNDKVIKSDVVNRDLDRKCLDEILFRGAAFRFAIPIEDIGIKAKILFFCKYKDVTMEKKIIRYGKFSPISTQYRHAYCHLGNYHLKAKNNYIRIRKANRLKTMRKEVSFWIELLAGKKHEKKAAIARILYFTLGAFLKKQRWLIYDKLDRADDNGEAFFIYLNETKKDEVKPVFAVSKNTSDYKRIEKIGKVVDYLSIKHKMEHLLSSKILSAYAHPEFYNPFGNYYGPYRDILSQKELVFLQHGITIHDVSSGLNRYNKNFAKLISCTEAECHAFLNGEYYYQEDEVVLTGFARYDRLYDDRKKIITIMPTWRSDLFSGYDSAKGVWNIKPAFENSELVTFYSKLLSDSLLLDTAENHGYVVQFVPHPILVPYLDFFNFSDRVKVVAHDVVFRDMFATSSLFVTDYSSASFDFAYLYKPVLYCQFDKEQVYGGSHYNKGYFDYEENGFGEVEYTYEDTVRRIVEYIEQDCKLKDQYKTRIDQFYTYKDRNNCERIYESIK